MHRPPTETNFYDEQGRAQKPAIVTSCIEHLGHIHDGAEYLMQRTWKWTKKFVCLLDLIILTFFNMMNI
jgi:hypothetical protein